MNLPENIVNKSTYDYVVNLSKFSLSKYNTIEDDTVDKLIRAYKISYFDIKKVTKRMRDMKGRRVYRKVDILIPRKDILPSALPIVEKYYTSVPSTSPYKQDFSLLYSDLLIASGKINSSLKILYSLSNTSVYDEALLRIAKIGIDTDNLKMFKDSIITYENMKKGNIQSPIYKILKAILLATDGNISESLNMVRNLVIMDFTQKYEYVNYVLYYFNYLSKTKSISNISESDKKAIKDICFELIDYKFYPEAVKIANLSKIGMNFTTELILDMKLLGVKGWKTLAKSYLNKTYIDIVVNPSKFEKKLDNLDPNTPYLPPLLKSLSIHYIKVNTSKASEYLTKLAEITDYKGRVYLLASKLIDKLILEKKYNIISTLLDGISLDEEFFYRDIDRFFFFKGYAHEVIGNTNDSIKFYEKAIFSIPSGYYDYLASRRISELLPKDKIKNYYDRFISPFVSDKEKFDIAKILFTFDKSNYDTYKSFVLYKIKESNPYLMEVPYEIIDSIEDLEKSKMKSMLEKIKDEYVVVSKIIRNKMVFKGFSNVFSYVMIMRNRLENKITKGIYNEGNNITANKFVDSYSKFLPFSIQEVLYPIPYVSDVIYSAEKFGIDPNLVYAVMKQESFFQEQAYSRAGAIGLMQVLYSTGKLVAKKLDTPIVISNRKDLFKADLNIFLGTAYLSMLVESYGDLNHAISAYNGGARVFSKTKRKYKVSPDDSIVFSEFLAFRETKQYIKRVVKYYNVYSSIYNFDIVKREFNIKDEKDLEELKNKLNALQEQLGTYDNQTDEENELDND